MGTRRAHICIVGAGVIGLSSALAIKQALPGSKVHIIAEKFHPNTTSDGAFGLWEPYALRDTPADDIVRWGMDTLKHMNDLAYSEEGPEAGTFTLSGYSIWRSYKPDPVWKDVVPQFRHMKSHELIQYGAEYVHGWAFTAAATECRLYLPWLMKKLRQIGVTFEERKVNVIEDLALDHYDVIVNCSGIGARELVGDNDVSPIQGQVMRVNAPWVKHFLNCDDEDLYILPGAANVVLGGSHVDGSWDETVSEIVKKRILDGCRRILPNLKHATVVADWSGLRPSRSRVRVESEEKVTDFGKMKIVHNYGHGGAGITFHWGCALDTAKFVEKLITHEDQKQ